LAQIFVWFKTPLGDGASEVKLLSDSNLTGARLSILPGIPPGTTSPVTAATAATGNARRLLTPDWQTATSILAPPADKTVALVDEASSQPSRTNGDYWRI